MDFEVIWTEPAVTDLELAVGNLAEKDPVAAESLRVELLASWEILSRFPFIGKPRSKKPSTAFVWLC